MNKKTMAVLALTLMAPAAFAKKKAPAADPAQIKELHAGIKSDKQELNAGGKTRKARLKELRAQETAELAALKKSPGTRQEHAAARKTIRAKYAQLRSDLTAHRRFAKKSLRDDMQSKRGRIRQMRQGA